MQHIISKMMWEMFSLNIRRYSWENIIFKHDIYETMNYSLCVLCILARHLDFIHSFDKPFICISTHKKNKEVGKLNSPNFLLTLNFTTNS